MRQKCDALVIFEGRLSTGDITISPAVYLYADGRDAARLIQESAPRLLANNPFASCARFIGECHDRIPGNHYLWVTSLFKSQLVSRDELWASLQEFGSFPENGLYLVSLPDGEVYHYSWEDASASIRGPALVNTFAIQVPDGSGTEDHPPRRPPQQEDRKDL
ncbi:hypothetical protein HQ520_15760 [bacterium]|nr:hypothetical protein [bacterium]